MIKTQLMHLNQANTDVGVGKRRGTDVGAGKVGLETDFLHLTHALCTLTMRTSHLKRISLKAPFRK